MQVCAVQTVASPAPSQRLLGGQGCLQPFRLTWWAEEAHCIIGTVLAWSLLPVEAPEALTETAMNHLASAASGHPVSGPGL